MGFTWQNSKYTMPARGALRKRREF